MIITQGEMIAIVALAKLHWIPVCGGYYSPMMIMTIRSHHVHLEVHSIPVCGLHPGLGGGKKALLVVAKRSYGSGRNGSRLGSLMMR